MAVAAGGLLARLRRDISVLERSETLDGPARDLAFPARGRFPGDHPVDHAAAPLSAG